MTTWCRFEKDKQVSYGLVEGDQVIRHASATLKDGQAVQTNAKSSMASTGAEVDARN